MYKNKTSQNLAKTLHKTAAESCVPVERQRRETGAQLSAAVLCKVFAKFCDVFGSFLDRFWSAPRAQRVAPGLPLNIYKSKHCLIMFNS